MTTHTTSNIQKSMNKRRNLNYHADEPRNVYWLQQSLNIQVIKTTTTLRFSKSEQNYSSKTGVFPFLLVLAYAADLEILSRGQWQDNS